MSRDLRDLLAASGQAFILIATLAGAAILFAGIGDLIN